ncbi:uncharacterized protein STEHIDRAFT_173059 [Stereum hirsutum FP-91666 SS1]|uniref:Conserved oligomeric Golgi complex subunit 8 n=1 Tax=Stereum hirsutum (strain FP-91666) TaxID=721885 RepID=R7RXM2_STEHR|nr:uncharacterized protein STEHIDRAFT_173059 [Stereum hirsutum FP-91666 SS1]EIM79533.1 hypothetical protein STEHIDRAFT_173059 [Stereum hirsutum FP-91666 SS1]
MTTVPPLSPGGQSQSFTATSDFSSLVELLSGPLASTSSSSLSNTKLPDLQYTLTSAYLSHLTTLPLPSLLSEPTSLASTSSQLTNALTTLCTSSYPTFLSLHTSTSSLHSSLDTFSTSLSTLLDTLPALESSSQSFSTKIKHSSKLNDILELPFLTETCIRNGFYAEALDLHFHTAALAAKFPDVSVVADVKAEVDGAIRGLVQGIVGMFREPVVKLPALWKAVGFLRKMGVFGAGVEGEEELAVAFLSERGECLEAALRAVGAGMEGDVGVGVGMGASGRKEGWVRYLKKYVDVWREGVHDVVTQFSTIFLTPSTSSATTGTPTPPKTLTPLPLRPSTPSSTSPRTPSTFILTLLPTFTSNAIHTHLLPTLQTVLPHIQDPSWLTSLLTQLTYCATFFSRIGLDFRGLLGNRVGRDARACPSADVDVVSSACYEVLATSGEVLLDYVRTVEDRLSRAEGDDNEKEIEKGEREREREVLVVRRACEVGVRVLVPF